MNMQQILANMVGGRLAYLVVPLDEVTPNGKLTRDKMEIKRSVSGEHNDGRPRYSHSFHRVSVEVDAGFMVYFPRGHAIRMSKEELVRRGFDKDPGLVSLKGLFDPNSAIGRMMNSQSEKGNNPFADAEKQVIQLATARSGPVLMPEQLESPRLAHQRRRGKTEQPTV